MKVAAGTLLMHLDKFGGYNNLLLLLDIRDARNILETLLKKITLSNEADVEKEPFYLAANILIALSRKSGSN